MLDNPYQYTDYKSDTTREARGHDLRRAGVGGRRTGTTSGDGRTRQRTGLRRGAGARARRARAASTRERPTMTLSRGRRGRRPGPADRAPAAAHPGGARLRPRRATARFALTPQVLDARAWRTSASLGLWDIARPHLEALVARTGESSSMAQLDGSDIVYVARVVGAEDHRPARRDRHPLPGRARPRRARCCSPRCARASSRADPRRAEPVRPAAATSAATDDQLARRARAGAGPRLGAGRRGARARASGRSRCRCATAPARCAPR